MSNTNQPGYDGRCVQTLAAIDASHRCPACTMAGQLQRLHDELNLVRRERTELVDENLALRTRAVRAEEERDIAVRRAQRAVAERNHALFGDTRCVSCDAAVPNADWLSKDFQCGKCFSHAMATTEAA